MTQGGPNSSLQNDDEDFGDIRGTIGNSSNKPFLNQINNQIMQSNNTYARPLLSPNVAALRQRDNSIASAAQGSAKTQSYFPPSRFFSAIKADDEESNLPVSPQQPKGVAFKFTPRKFSKDSQGMAHGGKTPGSIKYKMLVMKN